jgi:hypothetical protein
MNADAEIKRLQCGLVHLRESLLDLKRHRRHRLGVVGALFGCSRYDHIGIADGLNLAST